MIPRKLESMIRPRKLSCEIYTDSDFRQDAYLFGESQSRVVVSLEKSKEKRIFIYIKKK